MCCTVGHLLKGKADLSLRKELFTECGVAFLEEAVIRLEHNVYLADARFNQVEDLIVQKGEFSEASCHLFTLPYRLKLFSVGDIPLDAVLHSRCASSSKNHRPVCCTPCHAQTLFTSLWRNNSTYQYTNFQGK